MLTKSINYQLKLTKMVLSSSNYTCITNRISLSGVRHILINYSRKSLIVSTYIGQYILDLSSEGRVAHCHCAPLYPEGTVDKKSNMIKKKRIYIT